MISIVFLLFCTKKCFFFLIVKILYAISRFEFFDFYSFFFSIEILFGKKNSKKLNEENNKNKRSVYNPFSFQINKSTY